jgi:hypothetical protein
LSTFGRLNRSDGRLPYPLRQVAKIFRKASHEKRYTCPKNFELWRKVHHCGKYINPHDMSKRLQMLDRVEIWHLLVSSTHPTICQRSESPESAISNILIPKSIICLRTLPWVKNFCDVFRLLGWVDEIFSKLPWSQLMIFS